MNKDLKVSITKFLDLFEEVFDRDWEYSKDMMGIKDETEDQKKAAKEMGLESIEIIAGNGTFINPKVEDETEDWGNRGALLNEYRRLKEYLENE
ncbi:hypothetical protein [Flammeovirga sp. OC4]|uniref:hypothetical protein n=1 Tax=Flammeovirga sp. OC4 TaxID=1382345 RepID=UPI0005C55AC6|nr:hypothetical protein [Flammeovirga sp. OC4]